MIGKTISHYKITEKIGDGGMGVVYKAHDTKLDRFVALKFLPHHFTLDSEANKRFINEAKTASSLQHNNICTVHEIGGSEEVVGGRQFICMDYYEGETLKQKIESGLTNITGAEDIINQTAEGLRAAHEKGIIHRDIKPSNIFVTKDGTVKILDFGLAKGIDTSQVTQLGATVGTVAYMSPEQLTGSSADNRTDIWSFGVVLFELLCGERPFAGEIDQAIIYSIINEDPNWELLEGKDVDIALNSIVYKCLDKNPDKRYQTINEMIEELKSFKEPSAYSINSLSNRFVYFINALFKRPFRQSIIRIIFAAVVLMLFFFIYQNFKEKIISTNMHLAILPINYGGEDEDEQNLCDGLPAFLTGQITKIRNSEKFRSSGKTLSVVSSYEMRSDSVKNIKEARKEYKINYAITIEIQFYDVTTEVHIKLTDAVNRTEIDSGTVVDTSKSRSTLQKDIAIEISTLLNIESEEIVSVAEAGITFEPDAFDDYLRAKNFLRDYESIDNINDALTYFYLAVNADTNYALAYAGLSEAYYRKYDNEKKIRYADSSMTYSYKALEKNGALYESHISLGMVHLMKGLHEEAIKNFNKAIKINMYNDDAYQGLNRAYNSTGKFALAEKIINQAIKLNPDNWVNYNYLGVTYNSVGDLDQAKTQFEKVIELRPNNIKGYNNLAGIYFFQEKFDSALIAMNKSNEIEPTLEGYNQLGAIYFNLNRFTEAADMFLAATEFSKEDYEVWGNLAESYFWSGQKDKANHYFAEAVKYCEQLLDMDPKNTYMIVNLAGYYSRLGDEENAGKQMRKAIRYGITDNGVMYTAASNFEFIGERDKALEWLKKAIDNGYSKLVIESYPGFEELRKDERYRILIDTQ